MATKKSITPAETDDVKVVQRVSVGSSRAARAKTTQPANGTRGAAATTTAPSSAQNKPIKPARRSRRNPLRAIGGYFTGAWQELRATRWPTRRATWSLTVAVIIFTAALMLFIVGIDYLFSTLFEQIIT